MVHSAVIASGSLYVRYDGGDVGAIDHSPCGCGLPSPRIKILGRWDDRFTLGSRPLLPYDVQLALEQEVPELNGTTCVIGRGGLARGRLRLLTYRARELGEGSSRWSARRAVAPVQRARGDKSRA